MPDTPQTRSQLQTAYADNTSGAISAQSLRNFVVTALILRGPWDNTVAYAVNDAVTLAGNTYICTTAHTGSQPPSANWSGGAMLVASSNLSDLASAATARTNLGLGTAATFAASAFDASGAAAAVQTTLNTAIAGKLALSGGTMTGAITLTTGYALSFNSGNFYVDPASAYVQLSSHKIILQASQTFGAVLTLFPSGSDATLQYCGLSIDGDVTSGGTVSCTDASLSGSFWCDNINSYSGGQLEIVANAMSVLFGTAAGDALSVAGSLNVNANAIKLDAASTIQADGSGNITISGASASLPRTTLTGSIAPHVVSNPASAANVDVRTTNFVSYVLTASKTIFQPTNATADGQEVTIRITQDLTGSRTMTWGNPWRFSGGTTPTITSTAGKTSFFKFVYNATTSWWDCILQVLNI